MTATAHPPTSHDPPARQRQISRRRRLTAVVLLLSSRISAGAAARLGRLLSGSIALGFAATMLVLFAHGVRAGLDAVALRALATLSWLTAGPVALSAARDLETEDRRDGVLTLLGVRGYTRREIRLARAVAAVTAIARALGAPAAALLLLAVALSPSLPVAAARLAVLVGAAAYVVALGAALGLLARWSAAVSPRRGRTLLLALVLGPYLLEQALPSAASLPALFGAALDRLVQLGGMA